MKHHFLRVLAAALTALASCLTVAAPIGADGLADLTDEELAAFDTNVFDLDIYARPFWNSEIMVNECVFPIMAEDDTLHPFKLTYPATKIISVKDYTLQTVYEEGVDYYLNDDGELVITEDSAIDYRGYDYLHPRTNPANYDWTVYYPHRVSPEIAPGWEFWDEGKEISLGTIVVTYLHEKSDAISRPEALASLLPRTMERLAKGEPITIVTTGDSVTGGAKSSHSVGIKPRAPGYASMLKSALIKEFGNENITFFNTAIGGNTSEFDEEILNQTVIGKNPDFVTMCYGMNDSSKDRIGLTDEEFESNIRQQIEFIKSHFPEVEILLITSVYGNYYTFDRSRYEAHARVLKKIADDYAGKGVAMCDPQGIESIILERKEFCDMMGDNMVHPNDFGMRVITNTVIDSIRFADIADYVDIVMEKITAAVPVISGHEEAYAAACDKIRGELISLGYEWDVTAAIPEKEAELSAALESAHEYVRTTVPASCEAQGFDGEACSACGVRKEGGETPADPGRHLFLSEEAKGLVCYFCGETVDDNERYLSGDANGDKKLSIYDAALIMRYVAGSDTSVSDGADFDMNGRINARDVALLVQYLAGWDIKDAARAAVRETFAK